VTSAAGRQERVKAPVNSALSGVIQRLEEIVEQETAALQARKVIDLKDFNDRKNQALLELSRAIRQLNGGADNQALLAQLGGLRSKLDKNRAVLKMHLEAVREISTTLSDVIRSADSDGTYSHVLRVGAKQ
jgi:uncharacterized protein YjcR